MFDTDQFSDEEILARTIWGEARGEGHDGMLAVACVIRNRANSGVKWWGQNVRDACLKKWQFSCWNRGDPNRSKLLAVADSDAAYTEALRIAADAMLGIHDDITLGACYYYDKRMASAPWWAADKKQTLELGHHIFLK